MDDVASWTTAAGTLALAVVGAGAIILNVRLVKVTRDAAIATRDAARAATGEAEATAQLVEETRRDRELNWQPVLTTVQVTTGGGFPGQAVRNTGKGPAYRTLVAWRSTPGEIAFTAFPVAVGPQDQRAVKADRLVQADGLVPDGVHLAIYCEDQFGIRYRFSENGGRPDIWRVEQPEPQWGSIWRLAGAAAPAHDGAG